MKMITTLLLTNFMAYAQVEAQLKQPISLNMNAGVITLSLAGISEKASGKSVSPTELPVGTDFLKALELSNNDSFDEIILISRMVTPTENTAQHYTRFDYVLTLLIRERGTQSKIELKGFNQSNDEEIRPGNATRVGDCTNTLNDPRSISSSGFINTEKNPKAKINAINAIEGELKKLVENYGITGYALLCKGDQRLFELRSGEVTPQVKPELMNLDFTKVNYRLNFVPKKMN